MSKNNMVMQSKRLLRAFHAACGAAGMTADDKRALVGSFGAESSTELTDAQLREAIGIINGACEGDKWRKRVMRAIGAYLTEAGRPQNAAMIKAIACRASGYALFNRIPVSRLQNLYYAFKNKAADTAVVNDMLDAQIISMGILAGVKTENNTIC